MHDDDLEQDDLEVTDDEIGDEVDDVIEDSADEGDLDDGDDDVAEVAPRAKSASKKSKAVDVDELPSIEAKQRERDELARAMEEFLARGGKVVQVDDNVVADPPKKPDVKYGSRPI